MVQKYAAELLGITPRNMTHKLNMIFGHDDERADIVPRPEAIQLSKRRFRSSRLRAVK
jgi:hypothetical protein